jgi:metal-dependent amidase/aminoacylase/carboxypeptidase family protein
MERVVDGVTRAMGAAYRFHYQNGAPPVINDGRLTTLFEAAAAKVVGAENIVEITEPSMGGDDFSYYLDHAPGVYFRLGTANDSQATHHPLHHACFDVDESALPLGARLLAQTAWDFLSQGR